ncbi:PadR family transcriptional regulator [Cellulomonas chengniuliangii]|uniref:PadR family transcriptional regulator n=1 Tax=Cellulomonas chengniuliangii TaxID=2968084 RepID=UPI001D0DEDD4|nr:PadR family transcriptional regulator [Cellulomonas chengniuliangii]MCC2317062.1 PadR family transcriptional regulator [Cellulomonas chengniuliangii]
MCVKPSGQTPQLEEPEAEPLDVPVTRTHGVGDCTVAPPALSVNRCCDGLEIATELGRHETLFTSEGTLYPLLARLRKQGWVETSWQESRSGPPRRYYSLTDEGRAAVRTFAAIWTPFSDGVDAVLGKAS